TFDAGEPSKIASVSGVQTTSSALVLRGVHVTGTIQKGTATVNIAGRTVTQNQTQAPMTAAEQSAFNKCMAANQPQQTASPGGNTQAGGGGGRFGGGDGDGGGARFESAQKCLPARFRNFISSFRIAPQRVQADVNTPSTDIRSRP